MKHCETCARRTSCDWQAQVNGKGCRAWKGIPCEPAFSASLAMAGLKMAEESAKKAEQEHDLAIWWEAYRETLNAMIASPRVTLDAGWLNGCADVANLALAAYKAKAAELASK